MSIGYACGGYFLTAGNGESGFGNREPSAGSRKSALRPCLPLSRGGWRAPIYSLAPHCLSGGRGPRSGEGGLPKARREPIASSRNPTADSRQPEAGSLHYALAHPCPRVGGERLYTLLRLTACQGGEGHAVARGDCRRHADSRKLEASSQQPLASIQ